MYLILAGLAIAAICGFLYQIWFCRRGPSVAKSIIKTTAIAMLAVVSYHIGGPILLTAGLAFCAIGDFFLSRAGDRAFLFGLIAFALGHVFYIVMFAGLGNFSTLMNWPWAAFALFLIFTGSFMARLLWPAAGELRFPVMVYITIIMGMGLSAISMTGQGVTLAAIGAGMFILSDMILSAELFLMRENHPMRRVTPLFVWLFYWIAQLAIFGGVVVTTVDFTGI